jgi:hypothetical protein
LENIGKHDLLSNQLAIGKLVIKNHELHGFRKTVRNRGKR